MKYFLHDCNAYNDEKISELFLAYGYEGLGLFYSILEKIGSQEKPIKTIVLKHQLNVGRKLEKCWQFMEKIGLISSQNGETFNERILSYSETYQVKKEKNREKISQWREKQAVEENVTGYVPSCNPPKVNISKVKEGNEDKRAKALVVSGETPQVTKKEYLEIVNQFTGKEKKEVVEALKAFIQKRPEFLEPYADYWNIAVQGCSIPQVKSLSESRIKKLKTRIQEDAFDFCEIIKKIRGSTKLKTESNWFSFDWVFDNQTNYVKIIEGNYDN